MEHFCQQVWIEAHSKSSNNALWKIYSRKWNHPKKLNLGKKEMAEIPDDSKELGFVQIVIAKGKNKVTRQVLGSWVFADYSKTGSFKTSMG